MCADDAPRSAAPASAPLRGSSDRGRPRLTGRAAKPCGPRGGRGLRAPALPRARRTPEPRDGKPGCVLDLRGYAYRGELEFSGVHGRWRAPVLVAPVIAAVAGPGRG